MLRDVWSFLQNALYVRCIFANVAHEVQLIKSYCDLPQLCYALAALIILMCISADQ